MTTVKEILFDLDKYMEIILSNLGIWGALISCVLITVESILPILPVCVFITLVFITFGNIVGFVISWVFTCLGCFLSFFLCRSKLKHWFDNHFLGKKDRHQLKKFMQYVDKISFSGLVMLVAIPFTPASVVNVAAGLSNMPKRKFCGAIVLGKIFMVYFWGYIGTTLIESLTHPVYLIRIGFILIVAFVASKIVNKYFSLE